MSRLSTRTSEITGSTPADAGLVAAVALSIPEPFGGTQNRLLAVGGQSVGHLDEGHGGGSHGLRLEEHGQVDAREHLEVMLLTKHQRLVARRSSDQVCEQDDAITGFDVVDCLLKLRPNVFGRAAR